MVQDLDVCRHGGCRNPEQERYFEVRCGYATRCLGAITSWHEFMSIGTIIMVVSCSRPQGVVQGEDGGLKGTI